VRKFFIYTLLILITFLLTGMAILGKKINPNLNISVKPYQESIVSSLVPTPDPAQFISISNLTYNFSFDLPIAWSSENFTKNESDGCFIKPGDETIEIRIYGATKNLSNEQDYTSLAGMQGMIKDFIFRDGAKGKYIETEAERYIVREAGNYRIYLYINSSLEWYQANERNLSYLAKSIRFGVSPPKEATTAQDNSNNNVQTSQSGS